MTLRDSIGPVGQPAGAIERAGAEAASATTRRSKRWDWAAQAARRCRCCRARRRGELRDGARVVESTSGTLGIGLAYVARSMGHPITLIVDCELEPAMRNLLRALGATLEIVHEPHP